MCIIVAKRIGIEMPSTSILRNCFETNSDGAGFMYADGKTVNIKKGFMTFDDFIEELESHRFTADDSVVMHFRIASSGGVSKGCCHPFPISDNIEELSALDTKSRVAVAHNGVISGFKTKAGFSDTMAYITELLAPLRRLSENFMNNDNAISIIESTCGSKLCFMDNSGDISTIGNFIENNGVLYSNSTFNRNVYNFNSYRSYYDEFGYGYGYGHGSWYEDEHDEYGESYESLRKYLPFNACQSCEEAYECVAYSPFCTTEQEADEFVDMQKEDEAAWEKANV